MDVLRRLRTHLFTALVIIGPLSLADIVFADHQSPVSGIAISNNQNLSFGKFAAGSGGSVTITPWGVRSASGGVVLLMSGSHGEARFSVSGDPQFTYSITLPADGSVTLRNSSGQTMAVNDFRSDPSGTGTLNLAGSQIVRLGATLAVSAGQATGNYSGSFDVIINYD